MLLITCKEKIGQKKSYVDIHSNCAASSSMDQNSFTYKYFQGDGVSSYIIFLVLISMFSPISRLWRYLNHFSCETGESEFK